MATYALLCKSPEPYRFGRDQPEVLPGTGWHWYGGSYREYSKDRRMSLEEAQRLVRRYATYGTGWRHQVIRTS